MPRFSPPPNYVCNTGGGNFLGKRLGYCYYVHNEASLFMYLSQLAASYTLNVVSVIDKMIQSWLRFY